MQLRDLPLKIARRADLASQASQTLITYHRVISACKKGEYLQGAHSSWDVRLRGLLMTLITYSWVISASGKDKHPRGAMHLLWEMPPRGSIPDAMTYGLVISARKRDRHQVQVR